MRMHKSMIHISDIVLCDGKTIKPEMLTSSPGQSDMHKFPTQRPTSLDLELWKKAPQKISSEFLVFTVQLQEYISQPHDIPIWTTNADGLILHHTIVQDDRKYHEVYVPSVNTLIQNTQSGQKFNLKMVVAGQSLFQNYASMTLLQKGQVLLHSLVPMCINPIPVSGFEHMVKSMANQTLWLSLNYDGDGSWMLNGMLAQSLVIIHDGSYMKELSPEICSAATMIYCSIAKARCKCTWAKQSSAAGPHRGEILGGLMTQLILNAAASTYHGTIPPIL
jgi:hypothetical protein